MTKLYKVCKLNCTGNCFNTAFYINIIKEEMNFENNKSEANIVEDELQKIVQSKKNNEHCDICYENSIRALWFAYQQLM